MTTLEDELAKLPPERRARIQARTNELHREVIALRTLREMLNLTQSELAKQMRVKQPEISKLEN